LRRSGHTFKKGGKFREKAERGRKLLFGKPKRNRPPPLETAAPILRKKGEGKMHFRKTNGALTGTNLKPIAFPPPLHGAANSTGTPSNGRFGVDHTSIPNNTLSEQYRFCFFAVLNLIFDTIQRQRREV